MFFTSEVSYSLDWLPFLCMCCRALWRKLSPGSLLLGLLLQEVSNYPLPCFTGMMLECHFLVSGVSVSLLWEPNFISLPAHLSDLCNLLPDSLLDSRDQGDVGGCVFFTISFPGAHPEYQVLTFLHILLFGEDRKGAFSQVLLLLFLWPGEEAWPSWMPFLSLCEMIRNRHRVLL